MALTNLKERWRTSENQYVRALRVISNDKFALVAISIFSTIVSLSIIAPILPLPNPNSSFYSAVHAPPSLFHLFGTDELGRDVLTRVLWGGRLSLLVGISALGLALLVGVPLGTIAGYSGGMIDEIVMRLTDGWMVFPDILLGLIILTFFGIRFVNLIIAIGLFFTPQFTRLVRSSILSIKEKEYILASRAAGDSTWFLISREILPNMVPSVIVQATVMFGYAILAEAGYSFLGLGVQPPTPDWGSMIAETLDYLAVYPWMDLFPGIFIFLTVMSVNIFGDRFRDAMDPRLAR